MSWEPDYYDNSQEQILEFVESEFKDKWKSITIDKLFLSSMAEKYWNEELEGLHFFKKYGWSNDEYNMIRYFIDEDESYEKEILNYWKDTCDISYMDAHYEDCCGY